MGKWFVWDGDLGHLVDAQVYEADTVSAAAQRFVNGYRIDEMLRIICVAPFADGIAERKEQPEHEKFIYRLKIRYEIERC